MINVPTYIITLDDASLRRELLIQRGLDQDLISDFISATDYRNLPDLELKERYDSGSFFKFYGRNAQPGEIGCSSSHRKIYKLMVENNIPLALILEDDIIPVKFFQKKINNIIKELSPLVDDGQAFICHLGVTQSPVGSMVFVRSFKNFRKMRGIWRLNSENSKLWLSHAYLISNSAAKKILNSEPEVSLVADDWSRRIDNEVFQHIFYSALLFKQDLASESQIGNIRFSDGLNPMKKNGIKEKIRRMIPQKILFFYKFILNPKVEIINISGEIHKE
jgi:GR25 family glycosyltransferase involved in LPS biosynthesis